jgi:hypothetical protein
MLFATIRIQFPVTNQTPIPRPSRGHELELRIIFNAEIKENVTSPGFHQNVQRLPFALTPCELAKCSDLRPNIAQIPRVSMNVHGFRSLGFLSDTLPFKELQARSDIRERALAAGDAADFSQHIRAQMVMP